jgi:hypothetical protein
MTRSRWLQSRIDAMDKARARPSKLEPERLILPPRGDEATRRSCSKCWYVMQWTDDLSRKTCPKCRGKIVEVTS